MIWRISAIKPESLFPASHNPPFRLSGTLPKRSSAVFAGRRAREFHYEDRGSLATIGRGAAVADLNWLHLSGVPAWLLWIFVHLATLVQFQSRLLVLMQWAWLYISYDRSARLITGENPLPLDL